MELSRSALVQMYKQMLTIRRFEEKVAEFLVKGMIHGTGHLYIGEEAVAVGACRAIKPDDYITSTHRGHGHCIAKGADLNRMMSELLGKETGYCKGKGGSMHIADVERGNLGANGVVGGGIPIACGAGITIKMKGLKRVVLCFFGDGAVNQGVFHESLNLASVWSLPVIFICENNQYAMSTATRIAFNIKDLSLRAASYGMPGVKVDGNDALRVYEEVSKAVSRARDGKGPSFVVCQTYRWKGHSRSDAERYRTREEIAKWKKKCPLKRFGGYLLDRGVLNKEEIEQIEEEVTSSIEQAVDFAQNSSFPSWETLEEDVYAS